MSYLDSWIAIGMLGLIAILIPLGMMLASWLLRPSVPEDSKRSTYESGEVPTGTTRIRFNIQYYMVALLFVIFDIETVLILPWTVIYRDAVGSGAGLVNVLVPMLVFIGVLAIGLAWAWRNGAVEWARSPTAERRRTGRGDGRTPSTGRGRAGSGSAPAGPSTGPGTGSGSESGTGGD